MNVKCVYKMKCFGKFGTWKVSKTEGRKRNDSDVILLRTWKNRFGELCERATHTNTILAHTHWFSMESAIVSTVFFPFFSHSALAYTCIQFNHTCMDMNVLPSFHSRTRIPVQFSLHQNISVHLFHIYSTFYLRAIFLSIGFVVHQCVAIAQEKKHGDSRKTHTHIYVSSERAKKTLFKTYVVFLFLKTIVPNVFSKDIGF